MNTPLSPQSGLEGQQKKIDGTFGKYLTRQEAARWAKLCLVWTQGYQNLNSQLHLVKIRSRLFIVKANEATEEGKQLKAKH